MKKQDMIRAWRDGEFYADLDAEQKAALPENPAALPSVDDSVLRSVTGGCGVSLMVNCPTSSVCTPCPPWYCAA
ncbi:MAG: mersacidin/lichenicidin family type 2 lantibiotic [Holophagales bacterium]|nr:mersacidin/lichenicidin family type 2 lantibiotic [Holophagales bacterium]